MRSFVKIKSSQIGEITLSFTYMGKSRPCQEFQRGKSRPCRNFNVEYTCFKVIRKNKILTKTSEFTVLMEFGYILRGHKFRIKKSLFFVLEDHVPGVIWVRTV